MPGKLPFSASAMCMTLSQLLHHPDQWKALCADPDGLKKKASEEGLRYEPVVSGIPRVTTRELEIEGFLIPPGAITMVSILSVLRDPEVYADPETFNIHRTDQQRWHLAFGAGAHQCLGLHLARLEMKILFEAILDRVAAVEPAGEAKRASSTFVGGLKTLPLKVTPA